MKNYNEFVYIQREAFDGHGGPVKVWSMWQTVCTGGYDGETQG